ncbi:hypothetical protein SFR_6169 [Streptomyces sp. FR-008]|nr:hypothetical protein SFR_6169 [Streptomyces sp. FR-008]
MAHSAAGHGAGRRSSGGQQPLPVRYVPRGTAAR